MVWVWAWTGVKHMQINKIVNSEKEEKEIELKQRHGLRLNKGFYLFSEESEASFIRNDMN